MSKSGYKVLARTYRPGSFSTLIGQDTMVRTLNNAITSGRLAHAFVLTGVRGVGKTTTARILAKGLNCTASDGPTVEPCGVCRSCVAIGESRHEDVLEMDAASRTGIDDIREIIESVRYAPASARFKVYIIDEVHMLSNQAFNGLLKTLEEPPDHVKFIFATTEIRKLPVTVLSRCQRFDLRRISQSVLKSHLGGILAQEGVTADESAIEMIARAAEGSVRDGLSLLDQAIAHNGTHLEGQAVAAMLGYADRAHLLDLARAVFKGAVADALARFDRLYDHGTDPARIISDLLEISHELTRRRVVRQAGADDREADVTRAAADEMAQGLGMAELTRSWQILLKGLAEVRLAPKPHMAAEMVIIRLAHAATLPDPGTLVKQLKERADHYGPGAPAAAASPAPSPVPAVAASPAPAVAASLVPAVAASPAPAAASSPAPAAAPSPAPAAAPSPAPAAAPSPAPVVAPANVGAVDSNSAAANAVGLDQQALAVDQSTRAAAPDPYPNPPSFEAVVALVETVGEARMAMELTHRVSLVEFRVGHIALFPLKGASPSLPQKLGQKLRQWTRSDWVVSTTPEKGAETLGEQKEKAADHKRQQTRHHPLVRAVLDAFPGADLYVVNPDREAKKTLQQADVGDYSMAEDAIDFDTVPEAMAKTAG